MSATTTISGGQLEKSYLLVHQNVCITNIDFVQRKLSGYVELKFITKKPKLSKVRLNAKQCQIIRLLAKGCDERDYYSCTFTYNDPLLEIVPIELQPEGELSASASSSSSERTLKKFNAKHQEAVESTETDFGYGEIIVQLPDEVQKDIADGSSETFKIFVEYVIEQPQGGLHFVIPEEECEKPPKVDLAANLIATNNQGDPTNASNTTLTPCGQQLPATNDSAHTNGVESTDSPARGSETEPVSRTSATNQQSPITEVGQAGKKSLYAHLFTYKNHNSSRFWFPCLDSFNQLCTWTLEFTVESHLTVISCGDLVCTKSSNDRKTKTFSYSLNVPTSAPNIGFVAGQFETWMDSTSAGSNCPIKNYFLMGLNRLAKASCNFLSECSEFYEDFLTFKYPYSNYKQVFVDQAYEPFQSYATLSICCTNLLHSRHIIDQTFTTRSVLSDALASQYFGCFISMLSWPSAWLTRGISTYLAAQYRRKTFGNNEYRYNVQEIMKQLIDYEQKFGGIVLDPENSQVVNKSKNIFHFSTQSPHTISPFFDDAHKLKSFLVIRMLEDRIGRLLLVQVFNKILSLASNASQQEDSPIAWTNMLLSTSNFERAVFTVTGRDKEIASFLEHWIYQGGHAKFNGKFIFDRKRNVVELQIKQPDTSSIGIRPYFGPVTVTVQELDGTFPQKLNIEENKTTPFVITCHSKSRRNKKKKIPLCTGEEVDMDLSMMDNQDSPVLWIRIDPDMQILRQVDFEQSDYQWQYQLKYERDVTAQLDSLEMLEKFMPTVAIRDTLTGIIEDEKCYYRVRCSAALNLTKVANKMATTTTSGVWQTPKPMIDIYTRLFGSHSCPDIVKLNNFSITNLQSYFLQKTIPKALAGLRVPHKRVCPTKVREFLLDLLKYDDNSKNNFSDNYYRASLIEALAQTVTPVDVPLFNNTMQETEVDQVLPSKTKMKQVAEEITRCLNLEKILPGYKYVVTVACLKAIQQLQRTGHLPSNSHLFRSYTAYNLFFDVRCAAVVELVEIIRTEQSHEDLEFLLQLIETDRVPAFKFFILAEFHRKPPAIHTFPTYINKGIRDRMWIMINSTFAHDSKLRCAAADVFHKLFGSRSILSSSFAGDMNYKPKKKKKKKDKDRDKDREKKKLKKKEKHRLMESQLNLSQNQKTSFTSLQLSSQPVPAGTMTDD